MKKAVQIFLVLLAVFLLLGCVSHPPSANAEAKKVRIGDVPLINYAPFYMALEKGYFKEAGVEVERVKFESPNQITDALMQGQIDFGGMGMPLGIIGISDYKNPGKIKVFAVSGGTKKAPNESLVVRADSNISSIRGLKGKKLGVLVGIQWRTIATHLLSLNGLEADKDVALVELAAGLQVPALAAKQIDALLALEPMPTMAVAKGIGKVVVPGPAEQAIADPFYAGAGAVNAKFAAENPETTKKVIEVLERAAKEINENPGVARQYLKGYTPLTEDLILKTPVPVYKFCQNLDEKDMESIQNFLDIFTTYGAIQDRINPNSILYCKK